MNDAEIVAYVRRGGHAGKITIRRCRLCNAAEWQTDEEQEGAIELVLMQPDACRNADCRALVAFMGLPAVRALQRMVAQTVRAELVVVLETET